MLLDIPQDQVFYDIVLSVENDVSQLSEVLDHVLCLEVAIDRYQVVGSELEVGIFDELFNQRIKNSRELPVLREPRSTRQTLSGVCILQKVDHVVEGQVLLAPDLSLERLVLGVVRDGELPENSELFDGLSSGLFSLKVLDDHI